MHEHVTSHSPGENDALAAAQRALAGLTGLGISSVVDVTGRSRAGSARGLRDLEVLTERLDVNLVVGFGCYKDPFLTEMALGLELDELVELYRRQATDGIGGSRVRAGLFGEVGTSLDEITPLEELHLRAVARAHLQTGLAISTHCTLGTMALEQAMILGEEGADLSRVVLGHLDLRPDPAYLEQVLATGVNIAFDTFGKERFDYQLPGQALKQTFHRPDADRVQRARRAHRTWAQRPDRDLDGHDGPRGVLQPHDARRPWLRLPPRRRHPAAARRRSRPRGDRPHARRESGTHPRGPMTSRRRRA